MNEDAIAQVLASLLGEGPLVLALLYWNHTIRKDLVWWRERCASLQSREESDGVD